MTPALIVSNNNQTKTNHYQISSNSSNDATVQYQKVAASQIFEESDSKNAVTGNVILSSTDGGTTFDTIVQEGTIGSVVEKTSVDGTYLTVIGGTTYATSITSIANKAFDWCSVSYFNFENCTNLSSIGDYAFANMPNLQGIAFNNNLKTIGSWAFKNDSLLEYFDLSYCAYVGEEAFMNCINLIQFCMPLSDEPYIGENVLEGDKSLTMIIGCWTEEQEIKSAAESGKISKKWLGNAPSLNRRMSFNAMTQTTDENILSLYKKYASGLGIADLFKDVSYTLDLALGLGLGLGIPMLAFMISTIVVSVKAKKKSNPKKK